MYLDFGGHPFPGLEHCVNEADDEKSDDDDDNCNDGDEDSDDDVGDC